LTIRICDIMLKKRCNHLHFGVTEICVIGVDKTENLIGQADKPFVEVKS